MSGTGPGTLHILINLILKISYEVGTVIVLVSLRHWRIKELAGSC